MSSPFSSKKASKEDEREHPRLPLKPLHKISLQFEAHGAFHKIANISVGVGFFTDNISHNLEKKDPSVTQIFLKIENKIYNAQIEVVHRDAKIIGCRFVNPDAQLTKAIENYFTTELAALKLNRVETQGEDTTQEKMTFFRGQNNCEILIHEQKGLLQHFSIILFGNYIEGNNAGALWMGQKIELPPQAPNGVRLFKPMAKADQHFIESTMRFIDGTAGLSDSQKQNIISLLKQSGVNSDSIKMEDV